MYDIKNLNIWKVTSGKDKLKGFNKVLSIDVSTRKEKIMSVKDEIYRFCKEQGRPLTGREIVNALYPGKEQPYVNAYITKLVYEKKLVRDDSVKPYVVRLPIEDEEIVVKNYLRIQTDSNLLNKVKKHNHRGKREDICRPCEEEVERYLLIWEELENYTMQEKALDKLFFQTYPQNVNAVGSVAWRTIYVKHKLCNEK